VPQVAEQHPVRPLIPIEPLRTVPKKLA